MKMNVKRLAAAMFCVAVGGVMVSSTRVEAVIRPCGPRYCLDVWNPVTCSNGVTYSNLCYAQRACATGCVPGGPTK
jgi:hypothetical protein